MMNLKLILMLAMIAALPVGCSRVESHARNLTHPPRVFGEYTTQVTQTVDFEMREVPISTPGRRPEFDSYPVRHNVILTNRREQVDIKITNLSSEVPLAPHRISVIFHDGPEGHDLEQLSFDSGVIGPGATVSATLVTSVQPSQGTYFWSYGIERLDDWEAALETYEAAQELAREAAAAASAATGGAVDDWGDDW